MPSDYGYSRAGSEFFLEKSYVSDSSDSGSGKLKGFHFVNVHKTKFKKVMYADVRQWRLLLGHMVNDQIKAFLQNNFLYLYSN